MPDARNLTDFPIMIHSINNPVRPEDNLAYQLVLVFGNDAPKLRKALKAVGLGNQFISERHCALGVIARDEDDDVMKVVAGSGRPNQFVSHEANCFFTSS